MPTGTTTILSRVMRSRCTPGVTVPSAIPPCSHHSQAVHHPDIHSSFHRTALLRYATQQNGKYENNYSFWILTSILSQFKCLSVCRLHHSAWIAKCQPSQRTVQPNLASGMRQKWHPPIDPDVDLRPIVEAYPWLVCIR